MQGPVGMRGKDGSKGPEGPHGLPGNVGLPGPMVSHEANSQRPRVIYLKHYFLQSLSIRIFKSVKVRFTLIYNIHVLYVINLITIFFLDFLPVFLHQLVSYFTCENSYFKFYGEYNI